MRGFLIRWIITAFALWVADQLLAGIAFTSTGALIVSALVLGLVNAVIRPILIILTLPLTILTLGLFILIVNGISLALVAWLVPGFQVASLGAATLGAIIVSLTSWLVSSFVGGTGRIERMHRVGVEVTGRRIDG
jgi:putative membrane protein